MLGFTTALVVLAGFAQAQQIDVAGSGSTLWSSKNPTAQQGFLPPAEKGGTYPGANIQYMWSDRQGILFEGSFRYHREYYDGYQGFRPMFFDLNGVYSRVLPRKITLDAMAGPGMESLIFYNDYYGCGNGSAGCSTHLNANHFMLHAGFGLRYYFFRNYFVRPEAHYNYIFNNYEFHSNNVFRIGASVGYTFGKRADRPAKARKPAPAQPAPSEPGPPAAEQK